MLALSIPTQPGSFGSFAPTVARSYETAMSATVTSTAGDGTLSVTDTSTTFPGHLVNTTAGGPFALPQVLNVTRDQLHQPDPGVRAAVGDQWRADEPAHLHRPGQR